MPLDFRYHLASLTAVFGALLIGILLGVAMMDPHGLSEQVKRLRIEFESSQVLRNIDQRTDQFNERTQPLLIRHQLANRNVALVCNAFVFPESQVDTVRQVLEDAGATVTVQLTLKSGLMQVAPDQLQHIYQQLQINDEKQADVSDLMYRLGQDLGQSGSEVAGALEHEKLLRISGDFTIPISSIIYLGGAIDSPEDSLNTVDLPFLRACAERHLHVAAAEQLDVPRSVVADYQKVAQITIDNIDRAAGRTALILALSHNRQGHFGYKANADDVTPDPE